LVGNPKGKRPLGIPRRRWVDNARMDLGWGGVNWIGLALYRDRWRALANAEYRVATQLVTSRVVFSSMQLISSSWLP
jgi:hypothetical protein